MNKEQFDYIYELVKKRAAVSLERSKTELLNRQLEMLIQREGLASLEALFNSLQEKESSELHSKVIESVLVHETSFFRDRHPFDTLEQTVLPELIKKRGTEKKLSILCSACSTGQEPYSIAMIWLNSFPLLARTWEMKIIGTDFSKETLQNARKGKYNDTEVKRGLDPHFLEKYFQQEGDDWYLREEVKKLVHFQEMNLAKTWPVLPMMDVVFMRNVLMYFDVETRKRVLGQTRKILKKDGYLFMGSVESPDLLEASFESVWSNRSVRYRPK